MCDLIFLVFFNSGLWHYLSRLLGGFEMSFRLALVQIVKRVLLPQIKSPLDVILNAFLGLQLADVCQHFILLIRPKHDLVVLALIDKRGDMADKGFRIMQLFF
jgi:hypothetical protein